MAVVRQPEYSPQYQPEPSPKLPPRRGHLKVVPPTTEEAEAANAGQYAPGRTRGFVEKLSRNWAVRLGLVTAAGFAAYEYIPAVHETVDQTYHDVMKSLGIEVVAPLTFDNQKIYGKIGETNSALILLKDIHQATSIDNGKAIHVGFFLDFGPEEMITYAKGLTPINIDMNTYEEYRRKGVNNAIAFTDLSIGTIARAPFDGKISRANTPQADTYLGLTLVFQDNEGKWYSLLFTGAKDVKMIAEAPKLNPNTRFNNFSNWVDVKIGDPLFAIESKELLSSPYLTGFKYSSQLRIEAQYGPNGFGKDPWLPIDILFLTQDNKLLAPTK